MIQHHKTRRTYLTRINGKPDECPCEFNPTYQTQTSRRRLLLNGLTVNTSAQGPTKGRSLFLSLSLFFLHLSEAHFLSLTLERDSLKSIFVLHFVTPEVWLQLCETLRLKRRIYCAQENLSM